MLSPAIDRSSALASPSLVSGTTAFSSCPVFSNLNSVLVNRLRADALVVCLLRKLSGRNFEFSSLSLVFSSLKKRFRCLVSLLPVSLIGKWKLLVTCGRRKINLATYGVFSLMFGLLLIDYLWCEFWNFFILQFSHIVCLGFISFFLFVVSCLTWMKRKRGFSFFLYIYFFSAVLVMNWFDSRYNLIESYYAV